jgi:hypothetical protein
MCMHNNRRCLQLDPKARPAAAEAAAQLRQLLADLKSPPPPRDGSSSQHSSAAQHPSSAALTAVASTASLLSAATLPRESPPGPARPPSGPGAALRLAGPTAGAKPPG